MCLYQDGMSWHAPVVDDMCEAKDEHSRQSLLQNDYFEESTSERLCLEVAPPGRRTELKPFRKLGGTRMWSERQHLEVRRESV